MDGRVLDRSCHLRTDPPWIQMTVGRSQNTMKMGWQYPVQWLTETSLGLKLVECLLWTDPPWKHATSWRQSFRFFLRVFFYFLKIEANDNDAYVMMRTGCCCKATQHQGESYSEVFSIWAGIDRVEQQRLRQPDVRGSWLTYNGMKAHGSARGNAGSVLWFDWFEYFPFLVQSL